MDNVDLKLLLREAEEIMSKNYIEGSQKPGRRVDPVSINPRHNVRLSNNTRQRLMRLLVK